MPEDLSIAEVIERPYFVLKLERGLEQADAGRVMPDEQAKAPIARLTRPRRRTPVESVEDAVVLPSARP